ncbi:hypothetical protein WA026_023231 [Henosepilachna vigintioctopunctata]|uniref:C2H2-type domain-containing protein n=1 Tax=Henosepilachna vigintioctopunctata TaxID=420089 RepID=A0AAW1UMA7_9CUCU
MTNFQFSGRPYGCQICGKCYLTATSLKRHVRYECQKKSEIQCCLCDHVSRYNFHLKQHLKFVHKLDDETVDNHILRIKLNSKFKKTLGEINKCAAFYSSNEDSMI